MSLASTLRSRTLVPTSEIRPDDVVILVMGKTGSGMSNFINKLTRMPPEDGADQLFSCTKDVCAYGCFRNGKRFIFVDTPGFNNPKMPQSKVLEKIATWLEETYKRSIMLTGLLYTHSIADSSRFATDMQSFQLLGRLCGNEAADRVQLVTTMWDEEDQLVAEQVERTLKKTQLQSLIRAGARLSRFDNTSETAWNIVRELGNTKKALLLQKELVDMRTMLKDTTAGRIGGFEGTSRRLAASRSKKGGRTDLEETIANQRAALRLTPPGHQERFVSLVNLANSLLKQFILGGTLADLDEVIAFRRAALDCNPPTPDRCMCLLDLANCLLEKYQRLGMDADLAEAIKHARTASIHCPLEQEESCRNCIVTCVQLKARKCRASAPTVQPVDSGAGSLQVRQMIRNIVTEITKTLPLRLLNTYTGALCDRDAQISCFVDGVQYNELLSSTRDLDDPKCKLSIRKTVSKFFGYTTLSHRWGTGEPLLRNIQDSVYDLDSREGFAKLQNFCVLSLQHGYRWAWSDTCCIDKDSSSELQEAIGSMFSWYRYSSLMVVHLSDVSPATSFTNSVWFKRGWTLQELLASPRVLFYTWDWSLYRGCTSPNHKMDGNILTELQEVTQIGEPQLKDFSPGVDDARSKLQWASTRHTTRVEDVAYSLFGIFQVSLPIIYGETAQGALGRLLAEVISQSGDVSVLDWVGEASPFHSCFPTSLTPYQAAPRMQSAPSDPSNHNDVDREKEPKLYKTLVQLPSPRFVGRRLVLPCIVHRITRVKLLEVPSTTHHNYEIVASGLAPLKLCLSCRLQEGSAPGLPYALVRPWSPKLLDVPPHGDGSGSLLEWLGRPFNALLMKSSLHNEYKRIASDCLIEAHMQDPASFANCECQTLEVI
ncbi:hypothetical protein EDC04DRAFT_708802 [Pisolithus marmoratus]|nr:hypothetical protein EDC04DRAFT_708802 [Pisolithus marmoratus]